jgi:hypothetical protein
MQLLGYCNKRAFGYRLDQPFGICLSRSSPYKISARNAESLNLMSVAKRRRDETL